MYHEVKFRLTQSQLKKLQHAKSIGSSAKLRLSNDLISPTGTSLPLTEKEVKRLSDGQVHDVTISRKRIEKFGGILPIIPIIAGLIAGAATTAGGVAGTVSAVKNSRAADANKKAAEAAEKLALAKLADIKK